MDRIDIHIDVPTVNYKEMRSTHEPENSATIRERVIRARQKQLARFSTSREKLYCNAQMSSRHIRTFCELSADCAALARTRHDPARPERPRPRPHSESRPHRRRSRGLCKPGTQTHRRGHPIAKPRPHVLGVTRIVFQPKLWGITMWGQPPSAVRRAQLDPCYQQKCPSVRNRAEGHHLIGSSPRRNPATACRTPSCF